NPVLTG
ncbi:hypothetical protein CPC698_1274B, partial [Chlamydia psittaci C6/98]